MGIKTSNTGLSLPATLQPMKPSDVWNHPASSDPRFDNKKPTTCGYIVVSNISRIYNSIELHDITSYI